MRNGVCGLPAMSPVATVTKSAQGHAVIHAQQQRPGPVSWNRALVRALSIKAQLNIMSYYTMDVVVECGRTLSVIVDEMNLN